MSKSLVKLIDASLIPAAIMICGKVAGLWFANSVFKLEWGVVTDPNNFFSVKIVYATIADQIIATSYSNLIMYLTLLLGLTIVLVRALYLSSSKISPRMLARLATSNLLHLIEDSFEVYYKASIWIILLWLAQAALLINVVIGRAYAWTAVLTLATSVIATTILLRDVASEIELARTRLSQLDNTAQ